MKQGSQSTQDKMCSDKSSIPKGFVHIKNFTQTCGWSSQSWRGYIPENELWVKLGGDKGRGSFKFNFQLVNTPHPNSVKKTVLISVFKAGDSASNLHIALDTESTLMRLKAWSRRGDPVRISNSIDHSNSIIVNSIYLPLCGGCKVQLFFEFLWT